MKIFFSSSSLRAFALVCGFAAEMASRLRLRLRSGWRLAMLLFLACNCSASAQYVDTVDPKIRHQTIEYFAASDCWNMEHIGQWSRQNRLKVAELLFSQTHGIGLSGWRFNLNGGVERTRIKNSWRSSDTFETGPGHYDWSRCPGQRWFLSAAKEQGVPVFIAFCNSPPKRLTVNGLTSIDKSAVNLTSNLKPGMERQYGAYLGDILQHFKTNPVASERVEFSWISPVNEPQWDWTGGQEGTRARNSDLFLQYKAVESELKSRNLETHVLGPESGNIADMCSLDRGVSGKFKADFGDYVSWLASDPAMESILGHEVGYHSYWSDSAEKILSDRQKLRVRLNRHPGWKAAETEYCVMESGRDLGMATALRAMRVLHADLTIVDSVAWSWWLAVSNGNFKDGLIYTDYHHDGDVENILPSKLLWALGNYSRFIRPGMIRIELKPQGVAHDIDGVMGSAFLNPVTGQIAAVYINNTENDVMLQLNIVGSQKLKWTAFVTSDKADDDLRECPPGGPEVILPPRSVVTLIH